MWSSLVVEVVGCSGPGRISTLYLGWSRIDPLAVDLKLSTLPGHPALPRGEWSMLRDFLRYGLSEPTGDGAVRLRPAATGEVALVLGHRHYAVTAPRSDLEAFLDETERLVPAGADAESAGLDALVRRLLGEP